MTNLSQQLCEICGIKKKRITLYGCTGCKFLIDNECERGDNPCSPHYKYVYPDFTEPENLVKLLEIMNKQPREETLSRLLSRLIFETDDYMYEIKQQIRATEWKYE